MQHLISLKKIKYKPSANAVLDLVSWVLPILLIYCEKEYGSEEGNELVDKVFETIATTAYRESIELAKEKGSFPFLIGKTDEETKALREAFINTGFMKKMPEDIRESILEHGIQKLPFIDCCTNGIHWNNGWSFYRT